MDGVEKVYPIKSLQYDPNKGHPTDKAIERVRTLAVLADKISWTSRRLYHQEYRMPGKKTRVHTPVDKLPVHVRHDVDARLAQGDTYRAIAAHLQSQGYPIGKSVVGRYGQRFAARQERMQITSELAQALIAKVGETHMEEACSRLALDSLIRFLIDTRPIIDEDDPPNILAILGVLARVQTAAVQRERWKTELARRAEKAAEVATTHAKKASLSDAVVHEIRARILGLPA